MTNALILATWQFGTVATQAGARILTAGGSALDAAVAGATAVEDDASIDCVGRGGLPDADGHVTLDACVMTTPAKCGSVAALRDYPHATAIARRIMEDTIHVMLTGAGAAQFAAQHDFPRQDLLTPAARDRWQQWRNGLGREERIRRHGWLPPANAEELTQAHTDPQPPRSHDTVGIIARDRHGQLAGACSTSGMMFKVPGRVGDSPIIGHGLYVDPAIGAVVATGNGELIMGICGAFLVVELMRNGSTPLAACQQALDRIASSYTLEQAHQVAFIAIASTERGGDWCSAALRPGFHCASTAAASTRLQPPDFVLLS